MDCKSDTGNLNYTIADFLHDNLLLVGIAQTLRDIPVEKMLRMIELVEVEDIHLGSSKQAKLAARQGRLIRAAVDFCRGIKGLELGDE